MREDFPLDEPVHVLACDRQAPAAEALVHRWRDGRRDLWTFGDVGLASRALASRLSGAGVRAGMRVAVSLPQSPLAPVVHLALSRVEAVSVPLSPMLGPDALAPRLAAARPVLAIAHAPRVEAFREAAPALPVWPGDGRNLRVGRRLPEEILAEARPFPRPESPADRPFSVFFTSGTTAAPKGVVLPQRVVPARMGGFLQAHPGYLEREADARRFWSPAEWSWIGGLHDALFAPWLCGAPVVSEEREGHFDPARSAEALAREGVASAFLPPTALKLWRASGAPTPRLVSLHTAGEPLPEPVRAWAREAFQAPVRGVYGLTEAAFLVSDGRPSPGARVAVRDPDDGRPLGADEEGEVWVHRSQPTLMLGLLEDDGWRLPLAEDEWFRTGDLGRVRASGEVQVTGRLDDVIKTSGYRVSPGEIEAHLLRQPGVAECAVVGEPDETRGQAIVAYVQRLEGSAVTEAELVQAVRAHLAPYMVPRRVAFVDRLPTTATGKIVRRRLRSGSAPTTGEG